MLDIQKKWLPCRQTAEKWNTSRRLSHRCTVLLKWLLQLPGILSSNTEECVSTGMWAYYIIMLLYYLLYSIQFYNKEEHVEVTHLSRCKLETVKYLWRFWVIQVTYLGIKNKSKRTSVRFLKMSLIQKAHWHHALQGACKGLKAGNIFINRSLVAIVFTAQKLETCFNKVMSLIYFVGFVTTWLCCYFHYICWWMIYPWLQQQVKEN